MCLRRMSGGISGTAQAAVIAAGELTEKYPARKIVTIDTYAASLGEGLQALEAARMIEEGKSLDEIKAHLLSRRPHMCQFFHGRRPCVLKARRPHFGRDGTDRHGAEHQADPLRR